MPKKRMSPKAQAGGRSTRELEISSSSAARDSALAEHNLEKERIKVRARLASTQAAKEDNSFGGRVGAAIRYVKKSLGGK